MTQASNLRPVGVSRRSRRGARSRNRGSIRLVYRSGGSTMWESAEMSLWVIIATLLLGQGGSGREPGCVGHRRVPARYARARPLSKPPEGVCHRMNRCETTKGRTPGELVLLAVQTCRELRVVVCDCIADLIARESLRLGQICLAEIRLDEVRLGEVRSGEVGRGEVRSREVGLGEDRLGKDRREEARRGELRCGEVCLGEVRPVEVRLGKVRPGEVRPVEIRLGEVGLG